MTRTYSTTKALGIFLLGLIFGIGSETVSFMRGQCRQIETVLLDDFRVLAFLSADVSDSKGTVIEEKIRAMPGVAEAKFVSREAALEALQKQDPDLVKSIAFLGENPLNPFVEIRPASDSVAALPSWIEELGKIPGIAETRYKIPEWTAVIRAQLYRRFLDLIASLGMVFWCLAAAMSLWALIRHGDHRQLTEFWSERLVWGFSGTIAGIGLVFVAARPFQSLGAWSWPPMASQALLILTGTLGAGLFPEWHELPHKRSGSKHHGLPEHLVSATTLSFVVVALVLSPSLSWGQVSAGAKRKELQNIQHQLEQKKREISEYQQRASDMKRDMSKLAGESSESRRKLQALQAKIQDAEARKAEIKSRLGALEAAEGQWHRELSEEVGAYFREEASQSDLLGRKEIWAEAFRRAEIMEKMHYVRQLNGTKIQTQAMAADAIRKGRELQQKTLQARTEQQTKETLYQRKKDDYAEVQDQVSKAQKAIQDLQDSAVALAQLIHSLERKAPYRNAVSIPLAEKAHSLPWPVDGRIVSLFGKQQVADLHTWYINQGIRLATKPGAPIHPVKAGKVIFSGPFRSYGQVVIVDHGGEFFSIYGHMGQIYSKKGDSVSPAESLGTAGQAKDGGQLYFEIRQSGEALDPVAWLKK